MRSSAARRYSTVRSFAPSRPKYSSQTARSVSLCAASAFACSCAGSTPAEMSRNHSLAFARASSSEIAPTLPMARAVGLGEPGYLVTNTKLRCLLSVTLTAKPGTMASQTKVRLPFGGGFNAAIARSVSGFFASNLLSSAVLCVLYAGTTCPSRTTSGQRILRAVLRSLATA